MAAVTAKDIASLGRSAETRLTLAQIDALRWRMIAGEVPVFEVPIELLGWYWAGVEQAPHYECERRLAIANRDADDLYFRLHNPAEVAADRDRWLRFADVVLRRKSADEQWAELDRVAAQRAQGVAR